MITYLLTTIGNHILWIVHAVGHRKGHAEFRGHHNGAFWGVPGGGCYTWRHGVKYNKFLIHHEVVDPQFATNFLIQKRCNPVLLVSILELTYATTRVAAHFQ